MPSMPEREEKAWQAIEKAIALSRKAPANERAYVSALTKRYSKNPEADRKQLAVFYKDAMKEVTQQYPDDLDAATLYAESLMNLRPWQLWSAAGEPAEGTPEPIITIFTRWKPRRPRSEPFRAQCDWARSCPAQAISFTCRRISSCGSAITSARRP
jgi:hypothetical protein